MFSNPPISPFKKVGKMDPVMKRRKNPLFYKEECGEITK